jgi:hypothetical protein
MLERLLAFLRRAVELIGDVHKIAALLVAVLETVRTLLGRGGFGFATS